MSDTDSSSEEIKEKGKSAASSKKGGEAGDGESGGGAAAVQAVLQKLGLDAVPQGGLTDAQVHAFRAKYGRNEIPKKSVNPILRFLSFMWNPLSWAMEIAAIISIGLVDYIDFILIVALLLINATIGYWEEVSAGNAIAALESALAPTCKCWRNGQLNMALDSKELVPGDIIQLRLGDVIPADCTLLKGGGLKINQAALTGESLPKNAKYGDLGYSGATIVQGEQEALVHAIGTETFFGNALKLVSETAPSGHFQTVLKSVGYFCIIFIVIWVAIELIVQFAGRHAPCSGVTEYGNCQVLENILVLIVGGIPIAMPTVLSVTMAIGARNLAKRDAIVKRLTAVEEMAGMDVLCSDKTGTLTLNKLSVYSAVPYISSCTPTDILFQAALSASFKNEDAIDKAILGYLDKDPSCAELKTRYSPANNEKEGDFQQLKYYPFDPVNKVTRAKVLSRKDNSVFFTMKGAPQVVLNRAKNKADLQKQVEDKINELAAGGFRCIGVARSDSKGKEWEMTGLIPLFDPPRSDTKDTVARIEKKGVAVKMVTGDQTAIAITTCKLLGMNDHVLNSEKIRDKTVYPEGQKPIDRDCHWMTTDTSGQPIEIGKLCEDTGGFAQVYPEDKFNIVKWLQEMGHVCGMTGDGVNDAPALAKADIGIAVDDATDAARGAADIVLHSPGLSVIVDAIIGSRKIFQRMKNYCMYSIHNCVRITLTFGILTVAFNWYFPTIAVVLLAIFNDGCMLSVSQDSVQASDVPDHWNLHEIFGIAIVLGVWNAASTIALFLVHQFTDFFPQAFGLPVLDKGSLNGLLYLQVSISSMATIFVTRSRGFSWLDRPGNLLAIAFFASQIAASFLGAFGLTGQYPLNGVAMFGGCTWGYVLVAWVWSLVWYIPLDLLKFVYRAMIDRRCQSWESIFNIQDEVPHESSGEDLGVPPPPPPGTGTVTGGNASQTVS